MATTHVDTAARPMTPPETLTTRDGRALAARWFRPAGETRAVAVIAPAMAVPMGYYAAFGAWLAEQGIATLTFDYRGIGASRSGSLRSEHADVLTWAHEDLGAAIATAFAEAAGRPRIIVGHSLGGQLAPLVPQAHTADLLVTLAAGSGYWRLNAPPLRRRVHVLWWGAVPLLTPVFGYFPGGRLKMVGDVPARAMRQWRRWCLSPNYLFDHVPSAHTAFATFPAPVIAVTCGDDELLSAESIAALHARHDHGRLRTLTVGGPADPDGLRVTHQRVVHRSMREPVWERVLWPAMTSALPQLATAPDTETMQ